MDSLSLFRLDREEKLSVNVELSSAKHITIVPPPLIIVKYSYYDFDKKYSGQLESFVPHKTVSYSCLTDPVESDPPYCILKVNSCVLLVSAGPSVEGSTLLHTQGK